MNKLVSVVSKRVCQSCHSKQIKKDGCSASLKSAPSPRLIIDMDCKKITKIQSGNNCDYVFIGEDSSSTWVVPIELKSGGFKVSHVAKQLQDGINLAARWIPSGGSFRFVPLLFHPSKKRLHKYQHDRLRSAQIKFQKGNYKILLCKCGSQLSSALEKSR